MCACNNTMSVWVKFASILDLATTARYSSTPTRQPPCMGIKRLYDTQQVKISTCMCVCACVCMCLCVRIKSQSQCGFNLQAYWIWHTHTTVRHCLSTGQSPYAGIKRLYDTQQNNSTCVCVCVCVCVRVSVCVCVCVCVC